MAEDITFSWSAFEHAHVPKEQDWFWALGIITVAAACVSFFFANYLFGIFILLAGGTVGLLAQRENPIVSFEINTDGVRVGEYMYPYNLFRQFSISERTLNTPLLVFDTLRFLNPHLYIPLDESIDQDELREFLKKSVQEVERGVPLSHTIVELFGL